jgi:hypothetical protein
MEETNEKEKRNVNLNENVFGPGLFVRVIRQTAHEGHKNKFIVHFPNGTYCFFSTLAENGMPFEEEDKYVQDEMENLWFKALTLDYVQESYKKQGILYKSEMGFA